MEYDNKDLQIQELFEQLNHNNIQIEYLTGIIEKLNDLIDKQKDLIAGLLSK